MHPRALVIKKVGVWNVGEWWEKETAFRNVLVIGPRVFYAPSP